MSLWLKQKKLDCNVGADLVAANSRHIVCLLLCPCQALLLGLGRWWSSCLQDKRLVCWDRNVPQIWLLRRLSYFLNIFMRTGEMGFWKSFIPVGLGYIYKDSLLLNQIWFKKKKQKTGKHSLCHKMLACLSLLLSVVLTGEYRVRAVSCVWIAADW